MDTSWTGLTLPNIRKLNISTFFTFLGIRINPQNLPFCPPAPQHIFINFWFIYHQIIFYGFKRFWGLQEAPKYLTDSYGHILDRTEFAEISSGRYFSNIPGWGPRNVECLVTRQIKNIRDLFIQNHPEKIMPESISPYITL